ncbi:putative polysaccharide deacetylase PdaA precursor [Clostridium sp. N3C]|uniref:polysaccharide deacetylase family protein n=1 Tax=Clostridium sp. N3C TaxID=1776758 RepID=UPI00092E1CAD|nr:polysaccharide deacetylase family protein [Clostridium sp. N3C]SCN24723.1 putative polysaccharide deacetylase PdaA precursor [Clostridium sp. N3C]
MMGEAKKSIIAILFFTLILGGCKWKSQETVAVNKSEKVTTSVGEQKNENSSNQSSQKPEEQTVDESDKNNHESSNKDPLDNKDKKNEVVPAVSVNVSSLNADRRGWSWLYSPTEAKELLNKYQGYADDGTSNKYIYLTFDEGYENGYTTSILDTLKANDVKAAFFITGAYVEGSYNGTKNVELLKRMVNEGHILGNHSVNHKSMPSIKDEEEFKKEILGVEEAINAIPGLKMSKYFRPPMGDFSELSLYYTQKLGYKSIFFSFAYKDYDVNHQPNPEKSKQMVLEKTKPGSIVLLHPQSKTNAEILDSLIKEWKARGFEFKTLDELPEKGI